MVEKHFCDKCDKIIPRGDNPYIATLMSSNPSLILRYDLKDYSTATKYKRYEFCSVECLKSFVISKLEDAALSGSDYTMNDIQVRF